MYQNQLVAPPAHHLAPGAYAMNQRRNRQMQQSHGAPPSPAAAAAQIHELQAYLAQCNAQGYAANPWSGDTQAGGIGSPKSNCLIRADLGSVRGLSIDQKAYAQVSVDDAGTVTSPTAAGLGQTFVATGPGSFTLQLSLDAEDQAAFGGKIINNVGVSTSVSGDFPGGFDASQLENRVIKRSQLQVITGGTNRTSTESTAAFIAIVYSVNFPKSGMEQNIRNMPGVWQATKFKWIANTLPSAPAGLTYQVDTDVVLTYGLENPGMHQC